MKVIKERFEPGDGTSYKMMLVKLDNVNVISVLNFNVCFEFSKDQVLSESYLSEKWEKQNPWTVKAALAWLSNHGFETIWDYPNYEYNIPPTLNAIG